MRRKRTYAFGAIVVALMASIVAVVYAAPADQDFGARITNNKAPKLKFVNRALEVTTAVSDQADPSGIPPKANRVRVSFDRHIRFNTRGTPRCNPNKIENTTTEEAIAECGRAQVGQGEGVAALPLGGGGSRADFPATITAFNGTLQGKRSRVLLHSRIGAPVNATAILTGVLRKDSRKRFGSLLDVTVPPIASGLGAIAEFQVLVRKGKYVQARCRPDKPAKRVWRYSAVFNYNDAPAVTKNASQKCRRR